MYSRPKQNNAEHFDLSAHASGARLYNFGLAGHIRGEGWRSVDWNCSIKWTYGGGAGPLNCLGPQAPGHRSSPFRTHCDKFLGTTCGKMHASANFSTQLTNESISRRENTGLLHAFSFSLTGWTTKAAGKSVHSNNRTLIMSEFYASGRTGAIYTACLLLTWNILLQRYQRQKTGCSKWENSNIYFAFWLEAPSRERLTAL